MSVRSREQHDCPYLPLAAMRDSYTLSPYRPPKTTDEPWGSGPEMWGISQPSSQGHRLRGQGPTHTERDGPLDLFGWESPPSSSSARRKRMMPYSTSVGFGRGALLG